jgi:hypothetical protein
MLTSNPRRATSGFGDEVQLEVEKLVAHFARTFHLIGASSNRLVHLKTITKQWNVLQAFSPGGFLRFAERKSFGIDTLNLPQTF